MEAHTFVFPHNLMSSYMGVQKMWACSTLLQACKYHKIIPLHVPTQWRKMMRGERGADMRAQTYNVHVHYKTFLGGGGGGGLGLSPSELKYNVYIYIYTGTHQDLVLPVLKLGYATIVLGRTSTLYF